MAVDFIPHFGHTQVVNQRKKSKIAAVLSTAFLHGLLLFVCAYFIVFEERERYTPRVSAVMENYVEDIQKIQKKELWRQERRKPIPAASITAASAFDESRMVLPSMEADTRDFGEGIPLDLNLALGDFGMPVNFFGLEGRGNRVALIIDVSESMCQERVGGIDGYRQVESKVLEIIDQQLHEEQKFNIIVFAEGVSSCWDTMREVSPTARRDASRFIREFNQPGGNFGLKKGEGNYRLNKRDYPGERRADEGTTRLDLAFKAAFEMKADAVFCITDGAPEITSTEIVERKIPGKTREVFDHRGYQKALREQKKKARETKKNGGRGFYKEGYQKAMAKYEEEKKTYDRDKRLIEEGKMVAPEGGLKKPVKPKRESFENWNFLVPSDWLLKYIYTKQEVVTWKKIRQEITKKWSMQDILQQLIVYKEGVYGEKEKGPKIYIIGYAVTGRAAQTLKEVVQKFGGKYSPLGAYREGKKRTVNEIGQQKGILIK